MSDATTDKRKKENVTDTRRKKRTKQNFPEKLFHEVEDDVNFPNLCWQPGNDGVVVKDRRQLKNAETFKKNMYNWGFRKGISPRSTGTTEVSFASHQDGGKGKGKNRRNEKTFTDYWYHPENLFRREDAVNDFALLRCMRYNLPHGGPPSTIKDGYSAPPVPLASTRVEDVTGIQTETKPPPFLTGTVTPTLVGSEDKTEEKASVSYWYSNIGATHLLQSTSSCRTEPDPLNDDEYEQMMASWFAGHSNPNDIPAPWTDYIEDCMSVSSVVPQDTPLDHHQDKHVTFQSCSPQRMRSPNKNAKPKGCVPAAGEAEIRQSHSYATVHSEDNHQSKRRRAREQSSSNERRHDVHKHKPDPSRASHRFWSAVKALLVSYHRRHGSSSTALNDRENQTDCDMRVATRSFEAFASQLHHVKQMSQFTAAPAQDEDRKPSPRHEPQTTEKDPLFTLQSFVRDEFEKNMPPPMKDPPSSNPQSRDEALWEDFVACKYLVKRKLQDLLEAHFGAEQARQGGDRAATVEAIDRVAAQLEQAHGITFGRQEGGEAQSSSGGDDDDDDDDDDDANNGGDGDKNGKDDDDQHSENNSNSGKGGNRGGRYGNDRGDDDNNDELDTDDDEKGGGDEKYHKGEDDNVAASDRSLPLYSSLQSVPSNEIVKALLRTKIEDLRKVNSSKDMVEVILKALFSAVKIEEHTLTTTDVQPPVVCSSAGLSSYAMTPAGPYVDQMMEATTTIKQENDTYVDKSAAYAVDAMGDDHDTIPSPRRNKLKKFATQLRKAVDDEKCSNFCWQPGNDGIIVKDRRLVPNYEVFSQHMHMCGFELGVSPQTRVFVASAGTSSGTSTTAQLSTGSPRKTNDTGDEKTVSERKGKGPRACREATVATTKGKGGTRKYGEGRAEPTRMRTRSQLTAAEESGLGLPQQCARRSRDFIPSLYRFVTASDFAEWVDDGVGFRLKHPVSNVCTSDPHFCFTPGAFLKKLGLYSFVQTRRGDLVWRHRFQRNLRVLGEAQLWYLFPRQSRDMAVPAPRASRTVVKRDVSLSSNASEIIKTTAMAPMQTPRKFFAAVSIQKEKRIVVLGGLDSAGRHASSVESAAFPKVKGANQDSTSSQPQWTFMQNMTKPRSSFGAAIVTQRTPSASSKATSKKRVNRRGHNKLLHLVVAGGWNDDEKKTPVEILNFTTNQWMDLPPLRYKRTGCAVTSLCSSGIVGREDDDDVKNDLYESRVYVVGGRDDDGDFHDTVEWLDFGKRGWKILPSKMKRGRRDCAAVMCQSHHAKSDSGDDGDGASQSPLQLVVLGGYVDGQTVTNTVECFDFATGQWRDLPPMTHRRRLCAAVAIGCCVFVVGGTDGGKALSSVEFFDFRANCWTLLRPMSVPRLGCAAVVVTDDNNDDDVSHHVMVLGGKDKFFGGSTHSSVEALDTHGLDYGLKTQTKGGSGTGPSEFFL